MKRLIGFSKNWIPKTFLLLSLPGIFVCFCCLPFVSPSMVLLGIALIATRIYILKKRGNSSRWMFIHGLWKFQRIQKLLFYVYFSSIDCCLFLNYFKMKNVKAIELIITLHPHFTNAFENAPLEKWNIWLMVMMDQKYTNPLPLNGNRHSIHTFFLWLNSILTLKFCRL